MARPFLPASRSLCGAAGLLHALTSVALLSCVSLGAAQSERPRVSGIVVSQDGFPLVSARIDLIGTGLSTLTDRDGRFALPSLGPGAHLLEVSFIGHHTRRVEITIEPATSQQVQVLLEVDAVELAPVRVTASSALVLELNGFYQRRDAGSGFFFTADEILRMQPRSLTDVLRRVPGTSIQNIPGGYGNRQAVQMGRATALNGARPCEAIFYVNGQYFPISTDVGINGFIRPDEIAGIEVYSGSSTVPPRFASGQNTRCGVIVVWTRTGLQP